MGVYYFFYNKTRNNQQNKHVLNGRFCDFVTGFCNLPHEIQVQFFETCIDLNGWSKNDIILAVPDYSNYDIIKYSSGNVTTYNSDKHKYFECEDSI